MTKRLTTRSGSQYLIDVEGGRFYHNSIGWNTIQTMKVVDREQMLKDLADDGDFWNYIHALPKALEPELGKSLYIAGRDVWRLSTPIKLIEEIE